MVRLALSLFITISVILSFAHAINYRPVVLMHGITSAATAMDELAGWITSSFPDTYVVSIEVGNGGDDSILWPMNKQVEHFCASVLKDTRLKQGFNLLGYSQGSVIVRAAVERCSLPVYNLITLSGVHQGVFGIPYLLKIPIEFRELVDKYAYEEVVQDVISVVGYWRDPARLDEYTTQSHFLPEINNERPVRNETYRTNMLKLNAFVMTYSDIDEIISPPQSGWFMGYAPNSLKTETWNNSRQFTEDLIGMRTLWEQGKLHLFTSHTRHQDVPHAPGREFFMQNILSFFNNTLL